MRRNYSDLRGLSTLEERYDYLRLGSTIGESTFGLERYINQAFYRSTEWKQAREEVIARDEGLELGTPGIPLRGIPHVHHMNPITMRDIEEAASNLFNPEGLISTSQRTHNAIHFGDASLLPQPFVERTPGDTQLWRPLKESQHELNESRPVQRHYRS